MLSDQSCFCTLLFKLHTRTAFVRTLKAILGAVVASQSVVGAEEMELALQEAVSAYNADINEAGVSPAQAALGKQPRMHGDVLGNFGERLAEHGLIDSRPGLARQIAMREVAKVAMTRLHVSRSIRKASLARSRSTTVTQKFEPGMIVYFYRQTKYNNNKTGPSKKKLALRRWHGPGLLVALEGHANAFVSHKGQLTKCALEHLRPASSMQQVASEVWRDAIEEVVEAAIHDLTRRGMAAANPSPPFKDQVQQLNHLNHQNHFNCWIGKQRPPIHQPGPSKFQGAGWH